MFYTIMQKSAAGPSPRSPNSPLLNNADSFLRRPALPCVSFPLPGCCCVRTTLLALESLFQGLLLGKLDQIQVGLMWLILNDGQESCLVSGWAETGFTKSLVDGTFMNQWSRPGTPWSPAPGNPGTHGGNWSKLAWLTYNNFGNSARQPWLHCATLLRFRRFLFEAYPILSNLSVHKVQNLS